MRDVYTSFLAAAAAVRSPKIIFMSALRVGIYGICMVGNFIMSMAATALTGSTKSSKEEENGSNVVISCVGAS